MCKTIVPSGQTRRKHYLFPRSVDAKLYVINYASEEKLTARRMIPSGIMSVTQH